MNGAVRKMNLKGYKVFSLLFAAFCVLLCASGCSLQKKKNVLQDDDGTAVGIANPVVQSDPQEILDDTSSWAKDIRTMIKYAIEHFDEEMEEDEEL